jgi:hypothetical protein
MFTARDRACGYPACWRWPLPDPECIRRLSQDDRWDFMDTWQKGRCAVCGRKTHRTVTDHDHSTGLVRGFLCYSCNTYESHGGQLAFDRYRHVNPASVCGVEFLYAEPIPPAPRDDGSRMKAIIDSILG